MIKKAYMPNTHKQICIAQLLKIDIILRMQTAVNNPSKNEMDQYRARKERVSNSNK